MTTPTPPPTTKARPLIVSQELFDETVIENMEAFELSEMEAIQETMDQFTKSGQSLYHLVLTLPGQDLEERAARQSFLEALQSLDACVQSDGTVKVDCEIEDHVLSHLNQMELSCRENPLVYFILLDAHDGIFTIMSFLKQNEQIKGMEPSKRVVILQATLQILITILMHAPKTITSEVRERQANLRDKVTPILQSLVNLIVFYEHEGNCNGDYIHEALLLQLIKASHACVRTNEQNKRQWMQGRQGVTVLLRILRQSSKTNSQLFVAGCQLITVLCRFDDFRTTTHGITTSSAQDHVLEFGRQGVVPLLQYEVDRLLLEYKTSTTTITMDMDLLAAIMSAQRVLCIHDDIVQSMVAVGVLSTIKQVFNVTSHANTNTIPLTTATLGLVRNLCANDDVKCHLCVGEQSVLNEVLTSMADFPEAGTLQEHACGTLAAMALRKPKNALCIIQGMGPRLIVSAMRHDATNVVLQRQGALAIRNLACRLVDQATKDLILDSGAEEVLRQAGQHQACVDEAYAALRDLGCSVGRTTVHADGTVSTRPQMFGEIKATFRPTYDD